MSVRNNPWFWFGAGVILVAAVVAGAALFGCEDGAYCVVGEVACDEHEQVRCIANDDGSTAWELVVDCEQYEDVAISNVIDDAQFTCCAIDGKAGCHLVEFCELQAQACVKMRNWVDYQCKGVE